MDPWVTFFLGWPVGAAVWAMVRTFLKRELGGNWIGF